MKQLAHYLDQIFKTPTLRAYFEDGLVTSSWPAVVGAQIAAKAKPLKFERGALHIHVNSAAWRNELSMMRTEIINKLNEKVGQNLVKDIVFR